MKVLYDDFTKKIKIKPKPSVITVGVFDGIHLGHIKILKKLEFYSRKENLNSVVFTFDIPPKLFLKKISGYITDTDDKIELLKNFKIDYLWFFKTSTSFLNRSKEDFIFYIMKNFIIKIFIVGEDFKFAKDGTGNIDYLKKISKENNFKLVIVKKKRINNKIISSSLIRDFILNGNLSMIKKFLGRNYSIKGFIYKDRGLGRKIGFPTANINTYNYLLPKKGVYAGIVEIYKRRFLSAINIGHRPTVNFSKNIIFEAHIIDFKKNIVGKNIKIYFLERLRDEKKFKNVDELKNTIKKDIDYIIKKYTYKI